mmetsp:Transcript_6303/g.10856  ORF Transcript_6303/g.10856 Transcript_6303/m.10856 type:complete len:423 (+) Transcript_6303:14-1282(+)
MEEELGPVACSGYKGPVNFASCPSGRRNCYMNGARDGYECKCSRLFMFGGENCENNNVVLAAAFCVGGLVELFLVFVLILLTLKSIKSYRATTNDSFLASMQRNSRKRAQAFRIMASLSGGAACLCYALLHLFVFAWLSYLLPPNAVKNESQLIMDLNLAHITLSSVSLSIVYCYFLQLAETLGAVSNLMSRSLSLLLFMVSSALICVGIVSETAIPSLVAIGFIVMLGQIVARKIDKHVALQSMAVQRVDGSQQHASERATRVAVLSSSLKNFAEFMKSGVFFSILFGIALAAVDFLDFLFPSIFVVLNHGVVFVTTFVIQKSVVNFLLPRSSSYIYQRASTFPWQAPAWRRIIWASARRTLRTLRAFCCGDKSSRRLAAQAGRVFPGHFPQAAASVAEIPESLLAAALANGTAIQLARDC